MTLQTVSNKARRAEIIKNLARNGESVIGDFLAELITYRIEKSGDVTNILASIIRGIQSVETSEPERKYFDICKARIAEASQSICNDTATSKKFDRDVAAYEAQLANNA